MIRSSLSFTAFFIMVATSFVTATAPEDQQLLAHWSFDSSSGNTTFYDVTGNGFDAVCSKELATAPGVTGQALESTTDNWMFHVDNSEQEFTVPGFTIESLVYLSTAPGASVEAPVIFSHQSYYPGFAEGYALSVGPTGKIELWTAPPDQSATHWIYVSGTTVIKTNTWYHVAGTYDGDTLKVYVNGKLEGRLYQPQGYAPPHQPSSIACQEDTTGITRNWFPGKLDELKFYNYALSADSIAANYASYELPEPPAPVQRLIAHWSFDSTDQETKYYDVTGNGHTAISTNVSIIDGVTGNALDCNDKTFDISIANSIDDFNLPNFTIEGLIYSYENMVNPGSAQNFRSIFEYILVGSSSSITGGYNLQITDYGKLYMSMAPARVGGWVKCESSETLLPQKWYHVAATYDGSYIKLFLNGALAAQTSYTGGFTSSPIPARIGSQIRVSDTLATTSQIIDRFYGKIDELKLYNYALDADSLAAHFAAYELPEPPAPVQKLLAHWSFDSSSNNTIFYDVTGNGFDAVCSKTLNTAEGVSGKALESTATGYTFFAENSHPNFSVPRFSIEAWVYSYIDMVNVGSFYNFKSILSYQTFSSGITKGYHLDITDAGKIQLSIAATNNSWASCVGTSVLKPRTWYHVVGTYDDTILKVYVNGILEKTLNQSGYIVPDQDAALACQAQVGNGEVRNWFNGMIDELKLYNYPLDQQTIASDYERLKPHNEPSFEINLGMKTTHAQAGDTVIMPVYIANFEDFSISAVQLSLEYDPAKLSLLSITNDSGLVKKWELFDWNATTAGSIPLAMAGIETKLAYGEGELFRCVFVTAKELYNNDTCTVTLNDVNIDEKNNLIVTTVQNGRIIISHETLFYGDVTGNGEVNVIDAQAVLKYVVGALPLPDDCCPNFTPAVADVSGNGSITSYDAALIFQYSLGLIPEFPVETESFPVLSKRFSAPADKALFTFKAVSSSESEVIYDLVGTNLCGFYAGEFAISCNTSGESLSRSTITTEVRGATFSSRFNKNDNLLKVAVSTNDDIDNDDPVTIVRIILPPQQAIPEFSIKTALINEGAIVTEFENSGLVGLLSATPDKAPVRPSLRVINNLLTIRSAGSGLVTLTVWDLHGRRIVSQTATGPQTKLDISRFGRGSYIYRLHDGRKVINGRFMLINR